MKVVPTPLVESAENLKSSLDKLTPYFNTFHIDIVSDEFAPRKTISVEDAAAVLMNYKDAFFDFHFMTTDFGGAINYLRNLTSRIQIQHIFVHHKASPPSALFEASSGQFTIGLVINPDEEVKQLSTLYSLEKIGAIQIMSVYPGAQGQQFIKESLRKIEQLRLLNYRNKIFLDGGINKETLPFILSQNNTPDILAIGSFLTKADNLDERVKYLNETLVLKP